MQILVHLVTNDLRYTLFSYTLNQYCNTRKKELVAYPTHTKMSSKCYHLIQLEKL